MDWYPWGEEAFAQAKTEDKPVFLSIGYSTCHWCHVMAHESFEDDETASLLNEAFVCVKVDREERPDIDGIYMRVCQMMTGERGVAADRDHDTGPAALLRGHLHSEGEPVGTAGTHRADPTARTIWRTERRDEEEAAAAQWPT